MRFILQTLLGVLTVALLPIWLPLLLIFCGVMIINMLGATTFKLLRGDYD